MVICVTPRPAGEIHPELVSPREQKPGELTYGSSGNGSTHHLIQALFAATAGVDIRQCPTRGRGEHDRPDRPDGSSMLADVLPAVMPQVRAGKVRPLAITSSTRSPFFPELPTIAEQGSRLRGHRMGGPLRAGRDAGGHPRAAQRRGRQAAGGAGRAEALP